MLVGSLGRGIPRTRDPLGLLSLWDLLWDSSGIHETCVGPHVTRDTHVGLAACGWLDCLVFSWVFNLACSSTDTSPIIQERARCPSISIWLRSLNSSSRWHHKMRIIEYSRLVITPMTCTIHTQVAMVSGGAKTRGGVRRVVAS